MSHLTVTANSLLAKIESESIHSLFETIAHSCPEAEAVIHNNQSASYKTLNERAAYVARYLTDKGIKKGDIVAVKLDKGINLIVSVLAVMKAGATYLPVDPGYPAVRINYMLEDSNTKYLITSSAYSGHHEEVTEFNIDQLQGQVSCSRIVSSDPDNIAYLIYTSGTTGKPKGVMVEHAGFVNMCLHQIEVYQLGINDRVLQFASISFDASVYEMFIALLSGSTLVVVDKETILDRALFLDFISRQKLTFILLPPVFLNSLGRPELTDVKTIVTAGEACNIADALHYSKTKRYFNAYGPTEASVCVSLHQVLPDHNYENYIPIGKAIPGITFYILGEDLKPVEDGEAGELYIAGIGLAKGYINKPELTEKAFLINPDSGERIYRTGDIVKKAADGNLIIFGRKDNQVKILGHRIELGAIEYTLLQTAAITNAHVSVIEHGGEKYLCAYFTAQEEVKGEYLREKLLEELPHFMVPHWFIQVPAFSLTTNGKIDKEALPSPFDVEALPEDNGNDQPEEAEGKLLNICKEVLAVRQLSLKDNFFLMGGHSLKAARLAAKITKEFNIEFPVSEIYRNPQLKEILGFISTAQLSSYQPIPPAPAKRYYATSAAQKRMYLMNCTDKEDVSYNVSIVLRFDKQLTESAVTAALKILSGRHEVLRTRFDIQAGELVQEVLPEAEIKLSYEGIIDQEDLSDVAKQFVRPFDLSTAPVMNAAYCRIAQGGMAIIFDTHHIIADGTSIGLLVNEFIRISNGETLPKPDLQYRDYAEWENKQHAAGGYFDRHENYWLNIYKDIPKLKMPADRDRPERRASSGERLSFTIGKELYADLKSYAVQQDVSDYQLLLAVYYLLLSKYTNQEDIVTGTAVANRKREEVQQMMGMFVNTLALRATVSPEITFSRFLQNVKQMVLEAFEYQEYPFELLISRLGLSGKSTKIPLIDTLFVVQNIDFFSDKALPGLSLKYENATATSKFDFSFLIVEQKDSFVLEVEYNTGMFSQSYISGLAENFIKLAGKAVSNPAALLEEISFIDNAMISDLRIQLTEESSIADVEFDI